MRSRVFHTGEPAADIEFCLVFPGEALSVPVMRRVLGDTLSRLGMDESCVGDILLAVTEACSNVVRHAGPGRRYEVVAHVGSKRCLLEIVDGGRGLDSPRWSRRRPRIRRSASRAARIRRSAGPVARLRRHPASPAPASSATARLRSRITVPRRLARERAIAQLPESGRGMAIMRACVDDVTMRSRPGQGTVVSLQKRIEWRSDAPLARLPASQLRDAG
ncbi:MAG TPA: ATP-binding protein [Streptosporangiaceae bacterium]|nr:ATP-binding protein [Streptosporangiaceae bacterium]